jgi:response regulator of citrate/malate metabolism
MILVNETLQRNSHLQTQLHEPRRRVLIVEDDLSYRPMWEFVIQQVNPSIKVDWAQSVEQAEKLIKQRMRQQTPYDLIVADVFLAGIKTGVDLWERFGDWSSHFLFISGLSKEKFDELMSQDYSAPIYLQKPLRAKQCKEILSEILDDEGKDSLPQGGLNG